MTSSRPHPQAHTTPTFRLIEVLAPLSMVTDLGMGALDGHSMRACLLATGLARAMQLPETAVADAFYTTLLKHLGCTATAEEEAGHLGGDEILARPLVSRTDMSRPAEMLSLLATAGAGRGVLGRGRVVAGLLAGSRWGGAVQHAVCEVATLAAPRLHMTPAVQEALGQTFERWDGGGEPHHLAGDAIALPARIAHVASRALAFAEAGGVEAARDAVRASSGGWFDPAVAQAFEDHGAALLEVIDARDPLEALIEDEPGPRRHVTGDAIDEIARAFADLVDLKSPYTLDHSPAVERLASTAAVALGLDDRERTNLRHAAFLHDLGRVGVPSGIWEKRGALTFGEWERVRLHPYYTERILCRGAAFADAAAIASLHHERCDGSGYHRGSAARELPIAARILAAADAYQALTQPRPHRPARTPHEAADVLRDDARRGSLDADVVAAILDAAGTPGPRVAREAPAGLTEREVEVLRVLAGGASNQQIAERLVISRRTAEHHVQHIYEKIGVSTRPGAVLFALQHDLIRAPSA